MWVSKRMNVALCAGDLSRGDLQNFGESGGVKIFRRADLDLWIGGLRDQRRGPPDLQFEAHDDQQVRPLQLQEEAGLGVNEVGILVAACDGLDVNFVAADLL